MEEPITVNRAKYICTKGQARYDYRAMIQIV